MVCKGNGVNESPLPIEGDAVVLEEATSPFSPNNFRTGPIAVVLLGGGGGGAEGGLGEAVGFGGSAGGAVFNLFFLPQIAGT